MTLLAMVLAIGLVVDDAIVVVENVDRHIKSGKEPFHAMAIRSRFWGLGSNGTENPVKHRYHRGRAMVAIRLWCAICYFKPPLEVDTVPDSVISSDSFLKEPLFCRINWSYLLFGWVSSASGKNEPSFHCNISENVRVFSEGRSHSKTTDD